MRYLLLLLLCCPTGLACAAADGGKAFDPVFETVGARLRLHGTALLKVGGLFKVYAAGLYLAESRDADRVLGDVPKRLEIAYLRDIPRTVLVKAADDHFSGTFKPRELALLRDRLDAINLLYADVKEGDRYALTYRPGAGCELSLNGRSLGVIPGADFAAAYFGIWLGPGCGAPELRDALLKKEAR